MDTFSLFKFWKTNKSKIAVNDDGDGDKDTVTDSTFSDPLTEFSDGEDDDSYFELELTLPNKSDSKESNPISLTRPKLDSNSNIMNSKINNSKPQSPISILRSASPNLRIFMFGKLNRKSNSDNEIVQFKIEDGSIVPKLTRTNSSNSNRLKSDDTSKRFSKDVVQKYMNFVKPLYAKKSNESSDGVSVSCYSPKRKSSSSASSANFPSPMKEKEKLSRFKVKTKSLGKSKSSSAMIVSSRTTILRNDVPCDGIEGAILHCKRSFESITKGQSSLSRCSSDPSHEKSMTVSEQRL